MNLKEYNTTTLVKRLEEALQTGKRVHQHTLDGCKFIHFNIDSPISITRIEVTNHDHYYLADRLQFDDYGTTKSIYHIQHKFKHSFVDQNTPIDYVAVRGTE